MALLKFVILAAVALFTACRSDVDNPAADVGFVDASADLSVVADVGVDAPDGVDLGVDAPEALDMAVDSDWWRFETVDGDTFEGEVVTTYDTALWWNPLGSSLVAVFNPALYAPYPDDRSFRFVKSTELTSMLRVPRDNPGPTYREFLRQNGSVFTRPPLAETSFVITGNDTYHLEEDGYGDFAWDFERTDDAGIRYTGAGVANEDFLVWDQPVLSGVRGEVIDVVDTGVDNVPGSHPEIGTAVNNLVGIALGGSFYAYYLHFRQGGIEPGVVVGAQVEVGDVLGRAGNSGVTLEPHIHVVLLWYDVEAGRSYSVPAEFADVEVANSPTGPFTLNAYAVPESGQWLR